MSLITDENDSLKDLGLNSSANEIKEFEDSRPWQDVKSFLEARKQTGLERLMTITEPLELAKLQGELIVITDLINLPDQLVAVINVELSISKLHEAQDNG